MYPDGKHSFNVVTVYVFSMAHVYAIPKYSGQIFFRTFKDKKKIDDCHAFQDKWYIGLSSPLTGGKGRSFRPMHDTVKTRPSL